MIKVSFTIGYIGMLLKRKEPDMVKLDLDIENKARQILLDNGLYQVPTDLVKLAQNEKIGVKAALFNDEEVAGLLSFKDDQITIYVNTSDPFERRRFTIAHELGHYFLKHENEKVD
jgi:Zn-dependent peptidase ImmA (M78 family)